MMEEREVVTPPPTHTHTDRRTSDGGGERDPHDGGEGGGDAQHAHAHGGRVVVHEVAHGAHVAQHHAGVQQVAARQQEGL